MPYYMGMEKIYGTWLAAVSGGPDSMALLDMCLKEGVQICAAHVNYHHRREADEEEAYIRSFCDKHHVVLHVLSLKDHTGGNFEAWARNERYAFFAQLVKEYGYAGVLVAHQEDDLFETWIMQKEKNLVPMVYGLSEETTIHGIRVKRPLLNYTKKDLEDYCQSRHVRWYTDLTNFDESYERNRIRHRIVEKLSAEERENMRKEIEEANRNLSALRQTAAAFLKDTPVRKEAYCGYTEEERLVILRIFLEEDREGHYSLEHLKSIDHIVCTKKDFVISLEERELVIDEGKLLLVKPGEAYDDLYSSLAEMTYGIRTYYRIEAGVKGVNALTLKEVDFPVHIRSYQEGDRIQMRFGSKSLHRFFIDRHIPLYKRKTWPVIENRNGDVIFVSGLGCDPAHYSENPQVSVVQYSS